MQENRRQRQNLKPIATIYCPDKKMMTAFKGFQNLWGLYNFLFRAFPREKCGQAFRRVFFD